MTSHRLALSLAIEIKHKLKERPLTTEELELVREAVEQIVELLAEPCGKMEKL